MKTSPMQHVQQQFESKAALIQKVEQWKQDASLWLPHASEGKGLARVSNAKLLRLHTLFSTVKEQFGSRAKLVEAIQALEHRTNDAGYAVRLSRYPVPRLYDLYRAVKKRPAPASKKPVAGQAAPPPAE